MGDSMSVTTDASTAVRPADAGLLERLRASTLALDVAIVSAVSLVLGLVRLGAPALWFDEAYTWRQIHKGYLAQFEGYQPFYYWIEKPWTALAGTSEWALRFPSVVGAMLASALLVVLARKLFDRRIALVSGLLLRDEPVRRQVVAAGARLPAPARREPRRDAAPASRARPALACRLGGVRDSRTRCCSSRTRSWVSCSCLLMQSWSLQRRDRVLPHGLLAAVIVAAVGVPWVAQLAMRTDSETSETAWIPFPSAEDVDARRARVSRALQGSASCSHFSASGCCAEAEEAALAVWLAVLGVRPDRARARDLRRAAGLPRPLPRGRGACVRHARRGRRDGLAGRLRVGVAARGGAWRRRSGSCSGTPRPITATGVARTGAAPSRSWRSGAVKPTRSSSFPGGPTMRPSTTALPLRHVSTADSIWVLHWSEDGPELPADLRRPLGFGDHVLVERLQFGRRLSAELWRAGPDGTAATQATSAASHHAAADERPQNPASRRWR